MERIIVINKIKNVRKNNTNMHFSHFEVGFSTTNNNNDLGMEEDLDILEAEGDKLKLNNISSFEIELRDGSSMQPCSKARIIHNFGYYSFLKNRHFLESFFYQRPTSILTKRARSKNSLGSNFQCRQVTKNQI